MEQKTQINQPTIDIKTTTAVKDENGKPIIMAEGLILRKGNKFLSATDKDPLIPIQIMYDINNHKILLDMIPIEIRDDYKDVGFTLKP